LYPVYSPRTKPIALIVGFHPASTTLLAASHEFCWSLKSLLGVTRQRC
jgi:hypothetical protein